MKIMSTYSVKIHEANKCFTETSEQYRHAVKFFAKVVLREWKSISDEDTSLKKYNYVERLTIRTKNNPRPKYDFGNKFYKFPSYLRRAAIAEALGKVSSYKSNLANWEAKGRKGKCPGYPSAGNIYPAMYRDNTFVRTGTSGRGSLFRVHR